MECATSTGDQGIDWLASVTVLYAVLKTADVAFTVASKYRHLAGFGTLNLSMLIFLSVALFGTTVVLIVIESNRHSFTEIDDEISQNMRGIGGVMCVDTFAQNTRNWLVWLAIVLCFFVSVDTFFMTRATFA